MKALRVVCTFALLSVAAAAQSAAPEGEIYGGYQYVRLDTTQVQNNINLASLLGGVPPIDFGKHQNLNGWQFGGQENLNGWFGGVVEAGGSYLTKLTTVAQTTSAKEQLRVRLHSYNILAGPQFSLRASPTIQPFARALIGGAFVNDSVNILVNSVPLFAEGKESDQGWAFGGGGGIDWNISKHLGVRVGADYIRSTLFNDTQANLRGTASLVYRWGYAK
jgi:opacity protein-like surface antigen